MNELTQLTAQFCGQRSMHVHAHRHCKSSDVSVMPSQLHLVCWVPLACAFNAAKTEDNGFTLQHMPSSSCGPRLLRIVARGPCMQS